VRRQCAVDRPPSTTLRRESRVCAATDAFGRDDRHKTGVIVAGVLHSFLENRQSVSARCRAPGDCGV